MRKLSKKGKVYAAAATIVLVAASGGAAYAYWTNTGSGSGSGATGTNTTITAVQTSVVTGLQPGGAPQTLSGNFNNPNTSPVYVTDVTATIASVTKAAGVAGTCDSSDYTLLGGVMPVGHEVASGTGVDGWSGATIAFNDKAGTNQDACKGATVNLSYASR
ncbi:hypothetical protein [Arthrobacter bambusae]|uniref:hypothetical protein n=1 Tax=Arthrobacter bambusae TaxID=1338426 RepID=UPI0027803DD7|nr:hypothetical protein [Arthrobacter bambusae]MDQ0029204.1 hypothetical protein [Arthrobacter bambusae]MDQ0098113.1 hypothetical protein [Arthrobacter bambusae]